MTLNESLSRTNKCRLLEWSFWQKKARLNELKDGRVTFETQGVTSTRSPLASITQAALQNAQATGVVTTTEQVSSREEVTKANPQALSQANKKPSAGFILGVGPAARLDTAWLNGFLAPN